jgi:Domain of unknown function (DUF5666)
MTKTLNSLSTQAGVNRRVGLLSILSGAMALATGCGGGGGGTGAVAAADAANAGGASAGTGTAPAPGDIGQVAGVSSGGTGAVAVAEGSITGFGSIILNSNGIRIDDSKATVRDDDGNDLRGKLKLGMAVTVTGAALFGAGASASTVLVGGELVGRVAGAPNASAKTFVVLGQTVKVTGSTVFDLSLSNGFASLANDTVVEVHGAYDPVTNSVTASYVERKTSPSRFRVEGVVSNVDLVAKKFSIGGTRINYSSASDVRVTPVNGALIRVRLNAVLPPTAVPLEWTATRVRAPESLSDSVSNSQSQSIEAEIEGSISAFTSATRFTVNGTVVDATTAAFPKGSAGLAVGTRVEVRGRLSAGVLVAQQVKIESDSEIEGREIELNGTVSNVAVSTFDVRGVKVNYSASTEFRKGTVANLVNGAKVEVKGIATSSASSSTGVNATRISFE